VSRGLGTLQREILATLDAAKAEPFPYPGGVSGPNGYAVSHGRVLVLPEDVFDLRASSRFLAKRHDAVIRARTGRETVSPSFTASFSRAVRGLLARGALVPANLFVEEAVRSWGRVTRSRAWKTYGQWQPVTHPQPRFVRCGPSPD
jgi:hypothetical protein